MEGEAEPSEIMHLKRDLVTFADDADAAADWLANAMQSSWNVAAMLLDMEALADVIGERHRIIANNWQAASLMTLAGRVLRRSEELLNRVDFAPDALREDIAGAGVSASRLYSVAEMVGHAAELFSEFAGLVHDNERRWRVFRARVGEVVDVLPPGTTMDQAVATDGPLRVDAP
jgi:hypothetical protein